MMQQFVPHFLGDGVPFRDRMVRSNRNVQLRVQAMAQPSGPHVRHLLDTPGMAYRFSNFVNEVRLDTIQHVDKDGLARLPHDVNDGESDEKSDDGISQRIATPHTDRAT